MEYQVLVNGQFVDRDKAQVSIHDRGFRLGDVVFDTSRTFNGQIFRLRDHLERFYRSLKYVRINPGMSIDEMEVATLEVVKKNEALRESLKDDYMISQIVSGGISQRINGPTVVIMIDPLGSPRWAPAYKDGASVVISKTRSYSSQSLDPKVKHYSRLNFVLAELEATDVDPGSLPLLLDLDGNVSESTGANFFIVSDKRLLVPKTESTLQGVSRLTITELAKSLSIPVIETNIQPYDVYTADEAFLCSTPYCILPVGKVDGRQIGDAVPGDITNQLLAAWSEKVGLDIVDQLRRLTQ
ncbi:MAG: aminotransferase class IV [Chloroflexota bacterium]|nr:aminotransferase class IV [Chloroflexota bacterium]